MLYVIFLTNLSKVSCVCLVLNRFFAMECTWGVMVLSTTFQNRIEKTVLMATLKLCNALKQQIAENHFLIKWGPWGGILYRNLVFFCEYTRHFVKRDILYRWKMKILLTIAPPWEVNRLAGLFLAGNQRPWIADNIFSFGVKRSTTRIPTLNKYSCF